MQHLQSLLAFPALLGVAWLMSENRRAVRWRPVAGGVLLQGLLALVILRTPLGAAFFDGAQRLFLGLLDFARVGAARLLGESPLGLDGSTPLLAAIVVASVVFFASLFSLLHHLGVVRLAVGAMARVMARTLGTSGAESTSAAANIFVGQTEAPLLVRPWLPRMTRSELGTVMTVGFATVAGGVFGLYTEMLRGTVPGIAGHLLAASVMSAPMGLAVAKLLFPETGRPETLGRDVHPPRAETENALDALASGAAEGMRLSLNILAMLLAFLAVLALINHLLGLLRPETLDAAGAVVRPALSLEEVFGWILAPVAWLLGVPWEEAGRVGGLLGTKIAVNEFIAYQGLAGATELSERSRLIASYALCGFANFSSIAIQIGGLGGMCPERRGEIARLGPRALAGGALTSFLTAATAALLLG